jgi:hypothetical protein
MGVMKALHHSHGAVIAAAAKGGPCQWDSLSGWPVELHRKNV